MLLPVGNFSFRNLVFLIPNYDENQLRAYFQVLISLVLVKPLA